jgi:uncharacterized UBP type Zn finger protein
MATNCEHIENSKPIAPNTPEGCEECLKMGGDWVHLRLCLACGHVGCCDDSPHKHATMHFHKIKHPVIKSFEPGEDWEYCYVDSLFYEPNED